MIFFMFLKKTWTALYACSLTRGMIYSYCYCYCYYYYYYNFTIAITILRVNEIDHSIPSSDGKWWACKVPTCRHSWAKEQWRGVERDDWLNEMVGDPYVVLVVSQSAWGYQLLHCFIPPVTQPPEGQKRHQQLNSFPDVYGTFYISSTFSYNNYILPYFTIITYNNCITFINCKFLTKYIHKKVLVSETF